MASSKYLKCWYTNATSLNNKLDELSILVSQSAPDIIFITETHFNKDSVTDLEGYKCFRKDREDMEKGGVCIYVQKHGKVSCETADKIEMGLKEDFVLIFEKNACVCLIDPENGENCGHTNVEQVWCSLTITKGDWSETFLLGCIYRNKERFKELNEIIKESGNVVSK